MPLEVEKIYHELETSGNEWAESKALYENLDRHTKSVLADLTQDFMDLKMSRAESEMRAMASSQYKTHLAGVSAAHKSFLKSQVRYDNLKTLSELRRSEEATTRAEMVMR